MKPVIGIAANFSEWLFVAFSFSIDVPERMTV